MQTHKSTNKRPTIQGKKKMRHSGWGCLLDVFFTVLELVALLF